MKQMYYTLQTVLRGKGSNIIKITSLSLGLFVGVLLFARVAFELNYDNFYRESENLFLINATYTINGTKEEPMPYVYGKLPGAIRENFTEEIEDATVIRQLGENIFFEGENRLEGIESIYADEHFFSTTGIKTLKGNTSELSIPDVMFISKSLAKRIFGDSDPVGRTLLWDKTYPMTVRGVYADIPENSDMRYEAILSYPTISKRAGRERGGWGYDISYQGVIRFKNPTDAVDKVTAGLPRMMKKYVSNEDRDWKGEYSFQNVSEVHSSQPDVHKMIIIMSVLAITILLIAGLNYVLISLSSLARRAKAIGVHKCNGASERTIFSMFLWETGLIVVASILVVLLLMLNFKGIIEDTLGASLSALFSWQTLWVPLLVIFILFLVAGVLPGRIFSAIPVTQVFRRYTERKTLWKRPLLFVQFAGVPFVFGVLSVILLQYNSVMNRELNYNPERVAVAECYFSNGEIDNTKSAIRNLPMVEDLTYSWFEICNSYSGYSVYNESGKLVFDARTSLCDYNYLSMMGIRLIEGKNFNAPEQAIVNEEFVRRMHWTDSPVGKNINIGKNVTVVGVMKDYPIQSAYSPQDIVLMISDPEVSGAVHVRLKEPFDENLKALNEQIKEMYPQKDIVFIALQDKLDMQYDAVRRFRDSVLIASISILLITLMGLFGYINDEIRRRSKEIAVRKINGAEAGNVLKLLSKDIFWTALPAVFLGAIVAYFIGKKWLEQFSDSIHPGIFLFIGIALGVLLLIILGVIAKAWKIANENPVNSIKSE